MLRMLGSLASPLQTLLKFSILARLFALKYFKFGEEIKFYLFGFFRHQKWAKKLCAEKENLKVYWAMFDTPPDLSVRLIAAELGFSASNMHQTFKKRSRYNLSILRMCQLISNELKDHRAKKTIILPSQIIHSFIKKPWN